jgi:CPA2 family monovalent cation:H+ antiporter-2
MLFDPGSLFENTWPILATLFIIVVGKSVAAFLIVIAFGYPIATALIVSASLAQIGEFSFILAELGVGLELLPEQGRDLILAGAILSIVLNPLVFAGVDRLTPWLEKRTGKRRPADATAAAEAATSGAPIGQPAGEDVAPVTGLAGHTILIGYGRVGSLVGRALAQNGLPFLVIEDSDKTIARLKADGVETISGNAAKGDIFRSANAAGAKRLILAIPNAFEAGQIILRARSANPSIGIIARAHSDAEVEHLRGLGADVVIMGEREIARGIVEEVLTGAPKPPLPGDEPDGPKAPEPPV